MKSNVISSPALTSVSDALRTSPCSVPSASAKFTQRYLPSSHEAIRLRAPSSATCSIRRSTPTTKSGALALAHLQDPRAHPVGRRRARLEVGGDHLRRADAERVEQLEHVVAQLVVLADLDRRQVQPFVEAGGRRDRHPARLDRAGLGRVVGRARPARSACRRGRSAARSPGRGCGCRRTARRWRTRCRRRRSPGFSL